VFRGSVLSVQQENRTLSRDMSKESIPALKERIKAGRGEIPSDPEKDILKMAVVERHRRSGRIGLGLVRGFGLKRGALASSVAHDSHNVIAVGVNDEDLCRAVEEVRDMGGGMVVTALLLKTGVSELFL
jgi:adenine deaminase